MGGRVGVMKLPSNSPAYISIHVMRQKLKYISSFVLSSTPSKQKHLMLREEAKETAVKNTKLRPILAVQGVYLKFDFFHLFNASFEVKHSFESLIFKIICQI